MPSTFTDLDKIYFISRFLFSDLDGKLYIDKSFDEHNINEYVLEVIIKS